MAELGLYLVSIIHRLGCPHGLTGGKVDALDEADAEERSQLWIRRKKKALGCRGKDGQDRCLVQVKRISMSAGADFLLPATERIG